MQKIRIKKVERETSISRETAKAIIEEMFATIPQKELQKLKKLKSKKAA